MKYFCYMYHIVPSLLAMLLLSLISLSFTATNISTSTASKPKRLALKLLQRTSIQTHDTRAHLQPGKPIVEFYVSFSIGEPPVPQLAVLDTGSDLLWVKCRPCEKCGAKSFNPSKSLTFAKLPCNSSYCTNDCRTYPDECSYNIRYVNGPDSHGTIGVERFSFETSDEGKTHVDGVAFGCDYNLAKGHPQQFTGVFGLGPSSSSSSSSGTSALSIVEKFGSKFSYCIGNIKDYEYRYNMLILGEGAIFEGDSTPIIIAIDAYYVTLEGISVGEKMLDIDPEIFRRTSNFSNDGVFFDTGTATTWLVPRAYQTLRKEIEDLAEGLLQQRYQTNEESNLCYLGKIGRDLHGFPVMAFHFEGGAELVLDVNSLFVQRRPSVFCLGVGPSDVLDKALTYSTLIGMIAQQNYNVAYDLVNKQMYLQRIDCELLDE